MINLIKWTLNTHSILHTPTLRTQKFRIPNLRTQKLRIPILRTQKFRIPNLAYVGLAYVGKNSEYQICGGTQILCVRRVQNTAPERPPSDPRTMYSTRTGMRTRRRCFDTESRDLVMGCTCTLQAHCSSLQISVALHREVRELPRALSDAMPCCELYGRCCGKRLWLC